MVAGALGVVLVFGMVWAGGGVVPSRKPYASLALTKAKIWVRQLGKLLLDSLIFKVWFIFGTVKRTLDEVDLEEESGESDIMMIGKKNSGDVSL